MTRDVLRTPGYNSHSALWAQKRDEACLPDVLETLGYNSPPHRNTLRGRLSDVLRNLGYNSSPYCTSSEGSFLIRPKWSRKRHNNSISLSNNM